MRKASKPAPAADPARRHAVIYARVSSKEQEKEGFSIPAQLKLLKDYAAAQGFTVAQEYIDVETAQADRPHQLRRDGSLFESASGNSRAARREN
jgi:predicted site-specific integrase-resolvase